jgi:hypothetical protein
MSTIDIELAQNFNFSQIVGAKDTKSTVAVATNDTGNSDINQLRYHDKAVEA